MSRRYRKHPLSARHPALRVGALRNDLRPGAEQALNVLIWMQAQHEQGRGPVRLILLSTGRMIEEPLRRRPLVLMHCVRPRLTVDRHELAHFLVDVNVGPHALFGSRFALGALGHIALSARPRNLFVTEFSYVHESVRGISGK